MSKLGYKGDWTEAKERLMKVYPILTEKDFEESNDEKLVIHLLQKLDISKSELRNVIGGKSEI